GLQKLLQEEVQQCLDALLTDTADHYEITRRTLRNLARCCPDIAFSIARRLNTEQRRDLAFREIATSLVSRPRSSDGEARFFEAVDSISSVVTRDQTIFAAATTFRRSEGWSQILARLVNSIRDPEIRCRSTISVLERAAATDTATREQLKVLCLESVDSVDSPLEQAELLFSLS